MVDFAKIHHKVEKPAIFTQNTPEPIVLGHSKCTDDVNAPPAPTSVATDLKTPSETTGFIKNHQKVEKSPILTQKDSSALVSGVIKLKDDDGLPTEPTIIVPALETHSTTAVFTKNIEKSPILTQKTSKSLVSDCLNWADDSESLHSPSTAPTKQPRDLSGLRSSISSKNSFSSLQRRRRSNKNRRHFNLEPQYHCHHTPLNPYHHSQKSYRHSQPPFPVSFKLNWDRDPRLADLSNALLALGWVRR
jgi:hypothetical protein